jgi:hypothetical protein
MMKERPILFSGAMVRAILDGRKTQTRRVCKPRFDDKKPCEHFAPVAYDVGPSMERHCEHGSESTPCPYGVVGDRLWVKETWGCRRVDSENDGRRCVRQEVHFDYAADLTTRNIHREYPSKLSRAIKGNRPSIHMPRWASRIMLEVTGVRVERVQEIAEVDAIAEGIEPMRPGPAHVMWRDYLDPAGTGQCSASMSYQSLWDSINAKSGFGWAANPWVWVVEFKRV